MQANFYNSFMYHFFFNDCISKDATEYLLVSSLGATLIEFNKLKSKFPEHIDGITTITTPDIILLNKTFSLINCIERLDRSLKTIAFSYFTKYPIDNNFTIKDPNELVVNDYIIKINSVDYSAINAKIVYDNEGILFTLAIHSDLEKDTLRIFNNIGGGIDILNLYGNNSNTQYIDRIVNQAILNNLNAYNKLLNLVGDSKVNERFKKSFNSVSKEVQDSVIENFQAAIHRNGPSRFFADGSLIKDVTPEKENDIRVFELRIFRPVAYRVYFYELDKIYLALMEKKPADRVQDGHINTAKSIIKELMID